MEGAEAEEGRGMIPRAILQIFESAKALESKGWKYEFQGSYLEIYNESIRDLLQSDGPNDSKPHEIKHIDGKTIVTDLTIRKLSDQEDVTRLLVAARKNRSIGVTNMNERSSRSHRYVFRCCQFEGSYSRLNIHASKQRLHIEIERQ